MSTAEDKLQEIINNLTGNVVILNEKLESIDRLMKMIGQDMEDIARLLHEDFRDKGFEVTMVHVFYNEREKEYKICICVADKCTSDIESVARVMRVKNYIKVKYPELIPYVEVRI